MGYHYGYGGIPIPDGKDKLFKDYIEAKERLEAFKNALNAPVGSFAWEGAVHSGYTIESLEEEVRRAKRAYLNYDSM